MPKLLSRQRFSVGTTHGFRFEFDAGELGIRMAYMEGAVHRGVEKVFKEYVMKVRETARTDAPWQDQTGDARRLLTTWTDISFMRYTLWLAHQVDYGIWLEVRWSGRYATVMPTLVKEGKEMMKDLRTMMTEIAGVV